MFSVTGEVLNIFETPGGTDKKTGQVYDASCKVQLMGDLSLKNGGTKKELLTMNLPEKYLKSVKENLGKTMTLPVGLFASGGKINPYMAG